MNKIYLLLGMVIILVGSAYGIGISDVSPTSIELLRGESGRFVFQIQSIVAPTTDITCSYGVEQPSDFIVEFDQDNSFVPAGAVRDVLATVTVPDDLPFGTYTENFCVSCKPSIGLTETGEPIGGQSRVSFNSCGLEVTVDVVSQRSKSNMPLPVKPDVVEVWMVVMVVVGIVVVAGSILYASKKISDRKKKKKRK